MFILEKELDILVPWAALGVADGTVDGNCANDAGYPLIWLVKASSFVICSGDTADWIWQHIFVLLSEKGGKW